MSETVVNNPSGIKRWWIYQKERFPLVAHGPLIFAFSFCAVSYSARLRINDWPKWQPVVVAFICCLIFFLQLRIADEFKDAEEDARWRPYRAVPRGLVTLKELGYVFVIGGIIQLGLVLWWNSWLALVLLTAWIYLAAMSFEFGARDWLKARPITYMWTHMLIMPIVDFFATASDWIPHGTLPPKGLAFFLAASFCNGLVIEIGRKIRTPEQEEEGVETYSVLWGPKKASIVWLTIVIATAVCAVLAAVEVNAVKAVAITLGSVAILISIHVLLFLKQQKNKQAKMIEVLAAVWTLCLYLSLGILPGVTNG
jgi:4-hydroxybenzoate polyprenyltransferase